MREQIDWKVGLKVYFVRTLNRRSYGQKEFWLTVKSIGRKWVTFDNGMRIDKNNPRGHVDGNNYSSPGRVYLSIEEYAKEQTRARCYTAIYKLTHRHHTAPDAVPTDNIVQAALLLGIDRKEWEL